MYKFMHPKRKIEYMIMNMMKRDLQVKNSLHSVQ